MAPLSGIIGLLTENNTLATAGGGSWIIFHSSSFLSFSFYIVLFNNQYYITCYQLNIDFYFPFFKYISCGSSHFERWIKSGYISYLMSMWYRYHIVSILFIVATIWIIELSIQFVVVVVVSHLRYWNIWSPATAVLSRKHITYLLTSLVRTLSLLANAFDSNLPETTPIV